MNHAVSASIGLAPSRNEKQDLKKQWCGVEMSKEGSGGGGSGAEQEEEEEKGREDRDARRMESEDHDGGGNGNKEDGFEVPVRQALLNTIG
ncbi:unnamed protein product [Brassica oleracea]